MDNILRTKDEYDSAIDNLANVLINDVKTVFARNKNSSRISLTSVIKDWYDSLQEKTIQHLFSGSENQILNLMETISNDEVTFIQRFSKAVTSLRLEDWNETTIEVFLNDVVAFKETVEEYNNQEISENSSADEYKLIMTDVNGKEVVKSFAKSKYSDRAKLLYNEITNSIEEMGQAISESEIRQIIIEILEKHC